jgi:hypothetical protein
VRAPVSAKGESLNAPLDLLSRTLFLVLPASSPLYYITALTSLFESIAMIVDHHHPVVEKYYGPGKMTLVIAKLMEECDRVTKSITEGWEEERSMKRKVVFMMRKASIGLSLCNSFWRYLPHRLLPLPGIDDPIPKRIALTRTKLTHEKLINCCQKWLA